jgi:hypothetical protein
MIFQKKRILKLSCWFCLILFLAIPGNIYAQYENAWMNVGSLHNWYSEIGSEVEHGWVGSQQYGLRWPAIYNYKDSQAAKGLWIGCTNFTDENGTFFPYKVVHVGPRTSGAFEFFPIQFDMVSRFNAPFVDVDGNITYREFVEIDDTDPTLKADRMLLSVTNTSMGITMTRKIMQFSHPYHDNYIVVDFTFENTGNIDDDPDIEFPNQTLEGLYFFTQYRWAVNRETRYVIGNGTGWGMNTMLDTRGDGVKEDPPDEDFRAQIAWHGNFPQFSSYDNIGGPIWDPSNSAGYVGVADTIGRLGAAHFIGVVTLHADKSSTDLSDDDTQPSTTLYMGSDIPISLTNSQFDKVQMEEEYGWLSSGHMSPRHADAVYPNGDYWKGDQTEDPGLSSPGGFTACDGYGPYTLGPGESVNIVLAEAAAGLSREKCIEYGQQYKNGEIDAAQKNQYVSQSRDSLFQTFRRAIANYESNYDLAQPLLPPSAFYVAGGGDQIFLSWEVYDDIGLTGFEIYRAKGQYDSTYQLIAEVGPDVRSYDDTDLERGPGYYYYICSVGADIPSVAGLNYPSGKIKSGRFYSQTYDPTNLKRPSVEQGDVVSFNSLSGDVKDYSYMDAIRIVPNPYNISSDPNNLLFPGERDKLAFFNIPGDCDIKIFTEVGELITTIEHRNGTGDEYWNCITDSKQIIVSGIYIAVFKDNKTGKTKVEKFVIIR